MEQYQKAARLLDRIERELNSLGLWQSHQPPVQALESQQPFAVDTLEFHQWLQFIMLPRMWSLVDSQRPLPEGVAVSPMAAHTYRNELEQYEQLIALIREFDVLLSGTDPLQEDV
ncbi:MULTISPECIES: YqcC family protein [Idiomarina]|jgi:uncharacterized protein YqcC (DUF446 family)|uniref:YqcC family protein n=2 Tax=Idiomarina TaxID=135575 RepID=A0A8I1G937_9GAMM|nr:MULTISPECIES: YqcC family protein [Idiomarina]KPD22851.1 hypothetical protein ADS78_03970 [Idiomarina abyssalis]MAB22400.1 hypothetical protein [Idiomarina sp.]MAO67990.1 hypothetical protein [Idiomarina sp.]MBE91731.1 hypothetical protein [Idiomarina sp.]MBF79742.1 hypothetical protein [Idiomarina sp.]|tara:strand:- start:356 stop:700 length:345 start_codon:yes stop_codon:yes gene_type:complete